MPEEERFSSRRSDYRGIGGLRTSQANLFFASKLN